MLAKQCLQLVFEDGHRRSLLCREIIRFFGIGNDIVKFRLGCIDELKATGFQGVQRLHPKELKG